jgi:small subunit ribosomal protein S4
MRVKSKYKVARRLGASVFEKTQGPKFAQRQERRKKQFRRGNISSYGKQLLEKQRVRYTYNVSEKQFSNYVKEAIDKGGHQPAAYLYMLLERRLDNVVLRSGFALTRFAARQVSTHGHMMINGTRVDIPSYRLKEGDVITIREGSQKKGMFITLDDQIAEATIPAWLSVNAAKKEITVKSTPVMNAQELSFNLDQVLQFYKR